MLDNGSWKARRRDPRRPFLILMLAPLQKDGQNSPKKWSPSVRSGAGDGRMYAFLLMLGAVITAAGLALVASGVSIQEHAFDATNVTPGAIAVIGGCILIGLAFVVRALLRVERALMARPMPRPARPGEAAGTVASAAQPSESAPIPFPPKPKTAPQPASAAAAVAAARPVPAEAAALEGLRALTPERMENAPMVEESDVSLLPKAPVRSDEENGEPANAVAGRTNGAAHSKAAPPQVAMSGRPARRQQQPKNSIFNSLWPKAQRSAPEIHTAAVAQAAPPPPAPPPRPAEVGAASPPPRPRARCCAAADGRRGVNPQIRRGRGDGVYTLLGRFDRGAAARRYAAFRLHHRVAQSHRAERLRSTGRALAGQAHSRGHVSSRRITSASATISVHTLPALAARSWSYFVVGRSV